ncbi:MAG: DoxX family protein [Paludibacteraceae bacterium]|nr:DoxX family protein [Paludibacteraceae bacterium]
MNKTVKRFISIICRVILGVVFLFSGFVKSVDPLGTAYKITDYFEAFGMDFFSGMSLPLAILLIIVEFTIGFNFLFGVQTRKTSWVAVLFMLVMTPLTLYLAIENPVSDCGCFGDAIVLTNWQTFYKNIAIDVLLLFVVLFSKYEFPWLSDWASLIVMAIPVIAVLSISVHAYRHLPQIDFRPYKIGNSIKDGMMLPEGAKTDKYNISFVYAKDGVEQEFSMADCPFGDSTWVFVRQNSVLLEKGDVPPIHDFTMQNDDGEDITEDVLDRDGYTLLVVSSKVEKANNKHWKDLNALYQYALSNRLAFYGMTATYSESLEQYKQQYHIKFPFVATDEITLKTIIRSNPGLVLLKGDVVEGKWHYNDLPTVEELKVIVKQK